MNPLLATIQALIALHPVHPPWETEEMKIVQLKLEDADHQVVRQVAAIKDLPISHYANKALVSAARKELSGYLAKQPGPESEEK